MKIHGMLLIFCLLLLNAQRILSQCSSIPAVTVSGSLVCEGQTVPPLDVLFAQQIGIMRNELKRVASDENGHFEVTGTPIFVTNGEPELFLKLEYHRISKVERIRVTSSEYFDIQTTPGSTRVEMGPLKLRKHRCQAYMVFYEATRNYYERVGKTIPEKPLVSVDEVTDQPLPYVVYNQVISRKDFEWSFVVAQHEVGHIVRHVLDGDKSQFLENERLYGDPELRIHSCTSESSEGFAFNEGWAYFWADQCLDSIASGSHTILGDVAAALRNLQAVCDSSYAQMVKVLEDNPGVIYSYSGYEEKHTQMFGCP